MTKKDIIRKLTSRKLWAAIASFVSMMYTTLGGSTEASVQVTALIMAGATVIAYIVGEGLTDQANVMQICEDEEAQG